jgi:glycolate oxidase
VSDKLAHPPLAELLDDRYTESAFERSFYGRDLAVVPPRLAALVGQTTPAAVARPRTAEEVSAILRYAAECKLAVTPRAAATTAYWNTVPLSGGLTLDLTGLAGLVAIHEDKLTATVLPGTRWGDLDRALQRRGFTVLAYPTSAPAATVGGWLCMEGHGIGSLKFGGLAGKVCGLEVVLADGRITHVSGTSEAPGTLPVTGFAGSEGTLGIITRAELVIRRTPAAIGHHLLAFPDMAALTGAAVKLAASSPAPFYAHFAADSYGRFLRRAGFAPAADGALLAVTYDGEPDEVARGGRNIAQEAARSGGAALPEALAGREWDERFLALRLKRAGPSVLGAEAWLPVARLADYAADVAKLAARQGLPIATYGTIVTPSQATVMSLYGCDEARALPYLLALSLTKKLYDIAFRHGGRPYGLGVWNTPYLSRAFSAEELATERSQKRALDPANILNPGKHYAPPRLLTPPLFTLGMDLLAGLRCAGKGWL